MLSVTSEVRGAHAVVHLVGQVQSEENEAFAAGLAGLLGLSARRLILDCSDLDYLNSRGLGDLLSFYQELKARGGELAVAGARPAVLKVMGVVGLDRFLGAYPSVEAVEQAWAGR